MASVARLRSSCNNDCATQLRTSIPRFAEEKKALTQTNLGWGEGVALAVDDVLDRVHIFHGLVVRVGPEHANVVSTRHKRPASLHAMCVSPGQWVRIRTAQNDAGFGH